MTLWRLALATVLVGIVGLPLVMPFGECLSFTTSDVETSQPFGPLLLNTLLLVAGTVVVTLPAGTLAAVLLFRTNLPGRRLWIVAALLFLFIPLPVLMSAWQSFVGNDGWLPRPGFQINMSRTWTVGLVPAIWVHAMAGLPWVILIVGAGLSWVERSLEEEALLSLSPWQVLFRVTLPRCKASLFVAAGWLALSTFSEIAVTFFLQVSTIAEEIQTQFAGGSREALARSVLLSLPTTIAFLGLLLFAIPRLERALPPLQAAVEAPTVFSLGTLRWPLAIVVALLALALLVLPFVGLAWKVGLAGTPRTWSLAEALARLEGESRVALGTLFTTGSVAVVTAALTAMLGLVSCWLAAESRWLRTLIVVLAALAWSLPGPVIGIGLKQTIDVVLSLPLPPLHDLLYDRPSPVPPMWAQVIRFFPVAVVFFWPLVRRIPRELTEAARLEGATPASEFSQLVLPQTKGGYAWATLILTALCLGEVAASNRVETAGWESFAKMILDRMHYSVDSTVAALCLLLVGWLVGMLVLAGIVGRSFSREPRASGRGPT